MGGAAVGVSVSGFSPEDLQFIQRAALYLERPSFLMRMANMVGAPVEKLMAVLPQDGRKLVQQAVRSSLEKGLALAVATLPSAGDSKRSVTEVDSAGSWKRLWHQAATGATGAAGGFFGLGGLALELPVTTTLILRSIAAIAQDFGEDLGEVPARMECLTVFSLGGPTRADDAMESAYYAARSSLSFLISRAVDFAAGKTAQEIAEALARGTAPAVARLIAAIASRFDIVVTEKVLAQAVPAVGAVSGAFVNVAFTDHFNSVARYHFGIRRLERTHGADVVREQYDKNRG